MKRLTIMLYMAADNNLDLFASQDLNEVMNIGSSETLNVVAEVDRRRAFLAEGNASQFHTKRYYITKGNLTEVDDLGETNTGDYKTLKNFIEWGMAEYPAESYFLIIWNHGGGVKDEEIYARFGRSMKRPLFGTDEQDNQVRWVASDDTSRDFLDMNELANALDIGERFSYVGFDACLMSGFEILYQIKDFTRCMVASQEIEPLDGWDYGIALNNIDCISHSSSLLGKHLVDAYIESYSGTNNNVTLSALDAQRAIDIGEKVAHLAEIILNNYSDYELGLFKASRFTLRFRDKDYADLADFASQCKKYIGTEVIIGAADALIDSIKATVISSKTKGIDGATGLSILLPTQSLSEKAMEEYSRLTYSIEHSKWLEMINKMNQA